MSYQTYQPDQPDQSDQLDQLDRSGPPTEPTLRIPTVQGGQKKRKKLSKRQRILLLIICLVVLGGSLAGLAITGYSLSNSYHQSMALAQTGAEHLRDAEALLQTVPKQPFNEQTVTQAEKDFSAALSSFTQLNTTLQNLPGAVNLVPQVSTQLKAASHLVPLAISGSQAGIVGCQLLELFITKFHGLAATKGSGLTMADMNTLNQKFGQFTQNLNQVVVQAQQIKPSDLTFSTRLSKMFASLQQQMPTIQDLLAKSQQIMALAPALLGVSAPANYMLEILDSTELRPGGGFVGNDGVITITGGRLVSAPITDTSLLDHAFEVNGGTIAFPAAYKWFDIAPTWSLRDSNLDADFPTAARYAQQNFAKEGGKGSFVGVIAITPAAIEQVLDITGPIQVPEYKQTVTSKNLIDLIHYYQLGISNHGSDQIASSDGYSSQRKHFTALLAKHLFDRLHAVLPTEMPRFIQLFQTGLQTKDIQIYFNSSQAESLLQAYHLDSSIEPTPGDGLMVVDANIGATKANPYILSRLTDQVTIDAQGNVVHQTSISYAWVVKGPDYGNSEYRDYVRVYAPPESTLTSQQGWQARGTSSAFGHTVWAGFLTLTFNQRLTIILQWTDHSVAKKDASGWHYQYLVQRQPGSDWMFNLHIRLPSCASIHQVANGLTAGGKQSADTSHALVENRTFDLYYTCS